MKINVWLWESDEISEMQLLLLLYKMNEGIHLTRGYIQYCNKLCGEDEMIMVLIYVPIRFLYIWN